MSRVRFGNLRYDKALARQGVLRNLRKIIQPSAHLAEARLDPALDLGGRRKNMASNSRE